MSRLFSTNKVGYICPLQVLFKYASWCFSMPSTLNFLDVVSGFVEVKVTCSWAGYYFEMNDLILFRIYCRHFLFSFYCSENWYWLNLNWIIYDTGEFVLINWVLNEFINIGAIFLNFWVVKLGECESFQ